MEKQDLIRYRTFADALIRLNNAASTLLQEGANPEAIKLILSGTAMLHAELEERMATKLAEDEDHPIPLSFNGHANESFPVSARETEANQPEASN